MFRNRKQPASALDGSTLRAVGESGATHDDPSEDALYMLMEDIDSDAEQYVIVERMSDTSGQTYAQVIKDHRGGWIVERREGDPGSHMRTTCPDLRTAHEVITAWAFELPGPAVKWVPVNV